MNVEIGIVIPRKGIHKRDFRCSVLYTWQYLGQEKMATTVGHLGSPVHYVDLVAIWYEYWRHHPQIAHFSKIIIHPHLQ
jgi:hypothetical protein